MGKVLDGYIHPLKQDIRSIELDQPHRQLNFAVKVLILISIPPWINYIHQSQHLIIEIYIHINNCYKQFNITLFPQFKTKKKNKKDLCQHHMIPNSQLSPFGINVIIFKGTKRKGCLPAKVACNAWSCRSWTAPWWLR